MKIAEVLALTGTSRATFYRWRSHRGFPPPTAIGHFDEAAVRGWWETNRDQVGRWPPQDQPS